MFYVCTSSANIHRCGDKICLALKEEQDGLTCTVTGNKFTRECKLNPFTDQHMMNKTRLKGYEEERASNPKSRSSSYQLKKESKKQTRVVKNNSLMETVRSQLHDTTKGPITKEEANWYYTTSTTIWNILVNSNCITISNRDLKSGSQMYYFYVFVLLDITRFGLDVPKKIRISTCTTLHDKLLQPLKLNGVPRGDFIARKFRDYKRDFIKSIHRLSTSVSPELKPIKNDKVNTQIKLVSRLF